MQSFGYAAGILLFKAPLASGLRRKAQYCAENARLRALCALIATGLGSWRLVWGMTLMLKLEQLLKIDSSPLKFAEKIFKVFHLEWNRLNYLCVIISREAKNRRLPVLIKVGA
ncbi:hypothetical protein [Corynebacterium callunae]|uniref:Uncharacterized protein n=1 Tax=Corynebacterium callunae DSM 20147 TaxID=1121353 RepID=M1V0G4_9CORY|nr:hypothetical protein [Corynebacterium callunae]AGG67773.1 hypothetical protein H924_11725 [Corynebacterium callunae DSM 20147]